MDFRPFVDILDVPHADGKRFFVVSLFHVVNPTDGLGALSQTSQSVQSVRGESDDATGLEDGRGAVKWSV